MLPNHPGTPVTCRRLAAKTVGPVSDELSFFIDDQGKTVGPRSDDELRTELRELALDPDVRVRLASSNVWAPARAWATLAVSRTSGLPLPRPQRPSDPGISGGSPDLLTAPGRILDMLLFVVFEHGRPMGPVSGETFRKSFDGGKHRSALVSIWGTDEWLAARRLFDRTLTEAEPAVSNASMPELPLVTPIDVNRVRCRTCLEIIAVSKSGVCPECDEPLDATTSSVRSSSSGSIPDEPPDASWLRLHWRPLLTVGAIMSLIMTGITLRYLAPGRFQGSERPAGLSRSRSGFGACEDKCWTGEACQNAECVWQRPNGVAHVKAQPAVSGPFTLEKDVSDALLLDDDRFAVALLSGIELRSTKTGQALGLVSEALQTRKIYRVGDHVYGVGPSHVSVLDVEAMHVEKTIEMGTIIGDLTLGAGGRRALISLPGAHSIAIFSTEFNAEIDRIRFGDDVVGPVGADDTGQRALTTTGAQPVAGLPDGSGGAVYAFDPSRLGTAQDRVRASMLGNPVSILMTPDGVSSWVVLRAKKSIVELEWQPSGAVRQKAHIETCDQPEQIELVRKNRTAVVRCNRGRALEIFGLDDGKLIRHIALPGNASDMVISPDGEQAVVTLPSDDDGSVALVDLATYAVELVPLALPPSRIRIEPKGENVLVLSDRAKVAWVLR
jgi:hypothetical protein